MKFLRQVWYQIAFRGDRFRCPFCKATFNKFLPVGSRIPEALRLLRPIGIGRRSNGRCPTCGSNDRARLIYLYLQSTGCLTSGKKLRVLHIAPDRDVARLFKASDQIDYTVGSLFPEDFADLDARKVDVTDIPFEANTFDMFLCNHVLQQVPDDRKAMREISRILKPSGWGIVQVPIALGLEQTVEDLSDNSTQVRREKFGSTLHVRLYGKDYAERLRAEGLQVEPTHPIRDGWCKDAERYATIPEEEIFVVRKAVP